MKYSVHSFLMFFLSIVAVLLTSAKAKALDPYNCTYTNRGNVFNKCTMLHKETVGTATRYYHLMIPKNYVPGKSGLIVNVGGSGHGIHTSTYGGWCKTDMAGSEEGGWGPYLQSVPSPAPVLLCAEGSWYSASPTGHPERWNSWGAGLVNWDNGVIPNEPDFVRQAVLATVKDLALDSTRVYLTDDWGSAASIVDQIAIVDSDIFAAVGTYSTMFPLNAGTNWVIQKGSGAGMKIPKPAQPISVIRLGVELGGTSTKFSGMCGFIPGEPLNIDDILNFYASADGITSFKYGDVQGNNKKFCTGTYNSNNAGLATTLEMADGTGGLLGTEVAVYKLVGATKATPFCSFNWFGMDTYCSDVISTTTYSGPPIDLRNNTCNWQTPCNHFVNPTTGYDIKGLMYKFFLAHHK